MSFELGDVLTLKMDLVSTTVLAGLLLLFGYWVKKKLPVFEKFCFPAAVIGGVSFSVLTLILRNTGAMNFSLDTTLQAPLMLAFFTCVGFGGSITVLKTGGKDLLIFLVCCWILAVMQNVIGTGLASVLDINPVLGVMAGGVSLVGGHGNAAAFGPEAEALGVTGATTVAVAAATYGLIVGSLSGGPVAKYLIEKFNVPIEVASNGKNTNVSAKVSHEEGPITSRSFINHMVLIGIFMVCGILIATGIKKLNIPNFALPQYVGAMFVAIIFRNINDKFNLLKLDGRIIDLIQDIGLGFFLTMAIMTLKIWELADLAVPLIIILLVQTVFVFIYIGFVYWPAMGKNYDAAVMSSGATGVGLGVTATAVASMSAVCEKYNVTSYKALMIVPLCCAVFIDIVSLPAIIFFIGYFA